MYFFLFLGCLLNCWNIDLIEHLMFVDKFLCTCIVNGRISLGMLAFFGPGLTTVFQNWDARLQEFMFSKHFRSFLSTQKREKNSAL